MIIKTFKHREKGTIKIFQQPHGSIKRLRNLKILLMKEYCSILKGFMYQPFPEWFVQIGLKYEKKQVVGNPACLMRVDVIKQFSHSAVLIVGKITGWLISFKPSITTGCFNEDWVELILIRHAWSQRYVLQL